MAGNFIVVECSDCGNEQVLFQKASTTVNCAVCGTTLATPTGGKASIDHEVTGVVERRSASSEFTSDDTSEAR